MMNRVSLHDCIRALLDLVMPRTCIVCGCSLALHEEHICISCLADLPRTYFSKLPRNGMGDRFNELVQRNLDGVFEPYVLCTSLFFYRSRTGYSKITQSLKYHADISAGRYFSEMLGREMKSSPLYESVDAVIPVPLHWTRRWSRGYNQSEVIGSVLAKHLGADLRTDVLYRARRTKTQTKLSVSQKGLNVSGAFKFRKNAVISQYSHILLVDDVMTTGATLYSCYLALRSVLPVSVKISVATLACVDR